MKWAIHLAGAAALVMFGIQGEATARGFGAARGGAAGVRVGPAGGVQAGAVRGGTAVGPRGTVVQAGRATGVAAGPVGGVRAGAANGVRVTTNAGRTVATGSAGVARAGPGGVAVGRVGGTVASGPYGGIAVGGAARVGRVNNVTHVTNYVSNVNIRNQAAVVRNGYRYNYFTPNWYRTHGVAWVAPRWAVPNYWVAPTWNTLGAYINITAPPVVYNYGSNLVYNNNQVFYNGDVLGTAEQYAAQAVAFANAGRTAQVGANEEWQPLGVFGLIQGDEQKAERIFQLAVNKAGVVRGNYYDTIADTTLPVYGSVDPRTQRVAWSIGDKKTIVFETGLGNLTQDETTVLVHNGTEETGQMILVRLPDPGDPR